VLAYHLKEMDEMGRLGVNTLVGDIDAGGYFAAIKEVDAATQHAMKREGQHFGLLVKNDYKIIMYPMYRSDDELVAIQFRVGEGVIGQLEQRFEKSLKESLPLEHFRAFLND